MQVCCHSFLKIMLDLPVHIASDSTKPGLLQQSFSLFNLIPLQMSCSKTFLSLFPLWSRVKMSVTGLVCCFLSALLQKDSSGNDKVGQRRLGNGVTSKINLCVPFIFVPVNDTVLTHRRPVCGQTRYDHSTSVWKLTDAPNTDEFYFAAKMKMIDHQAH